MRHLKKTKKLSRKKGPRQALLKNLAQSIILYEKVKTTEAKAKVVKPQLERMITRAKKDNLHSRRQIMSKLPAKNAARKMFEVIGPRYKDRKGGYLKITKLNTRKGDSAKMVQIEFV